MTLPRYDAERAGAAEKIFEFTDFNSEANTMCLKIKDGKFKDVVFFYKRVKVEPIDGLPEGEAALTFEYQIQDVPETLVVEEMTQDDHNEFEVMLGDILVNIIQEKYTNES